MPRVGAAPLANIGRRRQHNTTQYNTTQYNATQQSAPRHDALDGVVQLAALARKLVLSLIGPG